MTSALLWLPQTMPRALKAQRVEQILTELVTDTPVNPSNGIAGSATGLSIFMPAFVING